MRTTTAALAFALVSVHFSTASAAAPVVVAPVVAAPVVVAQVLPPPSEGALDVSADESGTLLIDDAEYGAVPQKVEHLPPGPHRVTVRFDAGGESTRSIAVRLGAVTPVKLQLGNARRAFQAREGLHFGFGAEGVYSFSPDDQNARGGGRAFARLSYAPIPAVSFRGDLAVGALSGPYFERLFRGRFDCMGFQICAVTGAGDSTTVPVLLRFDAEFHLGSVFSMSAGVDVGATVMDVSGPATFGSYDGYHYSSIEGSQSLTIVVPTVGIHGSLLTFNFGPRREFTLAWQVGFLMYLAAGSTKDVGTFEQTASLSYRF